MKKYQKTLTIIIAKIYSVNALIMVTKYRFKLNSYIDGLK